MTESVHVGTSSDVPASHARAATETSSGIADAGKRGLQWLRWLMIVNLGFVALQALSAGFFLSGDGRGVNAHAAGAIALQCGALIQAVSALVLWRRRRLPGWVAGNCAVLLVIVFLEAGLGHSKRYWLHLPLGVLMFGGLTRQVGALDALRVRARARS